MFQKNAAETSNVLDCIAVETKDPECAKACEALKASPKGCEAFAAALDCHAPSVTVDKTPGHRANGQLLQILLAALPNIEAFIKALASIFAPPVAA